MHPSGGLRARWVGRPKGQGGSRRGWSDTVHDTCLQTLSTWQGGSVLSPDPRAWEGHRLMRVRKAGRREVLSSLGSWASNAGEM